MTLASKSRQFHDSRVQKSSIPRLSHLKVVNFMTPASKSRQFDDDYNDDDDEDDDSDDDGANFLISEMWTFHKN